MLALASALPCSPARFAAMPILVLAAVAMMGTGPAAAQTRPAARADAASLASARDLAADLRDARASGRALVVLYSTAHCPWCARVRRDYLGPMSRSSSDMKRVLVREIDIESDAPLVDTDGVRTTHRAYAAKRGIRFVPVTAFIGAGGQDLAPPIVGFTGDFYGAYLDERIEQARK